MSFICLNNGYYNTKIIKENGKEHQFETAIQKAYLPDEKNTIKYNEQLYIVGTGDHDTNADKTASLVQQVCVAYAMEKYGKDARRQPVDTIFSALPIDLAKQPREVEKYKAMLSQYAKNVKCFPETKIAIINDYDYYKTRYVCLSDIGGLTINSIIVNRGVANMESAMSTKLGTLVIQQRLKKHLEQTSPHRYNLDQMSFLIEQQHPAVPIILDEVFHELREEFSVQGYPTDSIEYRFTGGGATLLKPYLLKEFPNCTISDDAIWENVRGLYRIAKKATKTR